MFHSEFESKVDDKGRVILPAKLRECLNTDRDGEGFYITLGPDGCIELCTPAVWDQRVQELRQSSFARERARRFQRTMSALTEQSSLDKQGRLRISQKLLNHVGITRHVAIVGNFDTIEIWDRDKWQSMMAESLHEYKNDAEELFKPPSA